MSDPKPASSPLRFLTPGQLAICLVLFFLPWVELQCPMPKGGMKLDFGGPEQKMDSKDVVWTGFISQSGLEAATGKFSFSDSTMQQMAKGQTKEEKADEKLDAAPLLWVYLLVVIAGVGLGFAMPAGGKRKAALVACCAVAILVAGGQAATGFPIEKAMNDDAKDKGGAKGGAKADDMAAAMFGELKPKVKYKFPLYLSVLLCVGGLVTALMEPAGPPKPRRTRSGGGDGGDAFIAGGDFSGEGGDGGGGGGD